MTEIGGISPLTLSRNIDNARLFSSHSNHRLCSFACAQNMARHHCWWVRAKTLHGGMHWLLDGAECKGDSLAWGELVFAKESAVNL